MGQSSKEVYTKCAQHGESINTYRYAMTRKYNKIQSVCL